MTTARQFFAAPVESVDARLARNMAALKAGCCRTCANLYDTRPRCVGLPPEWQCGRCRKALEVMENLGKGRWCLGYERRVGT